VKGSVVAVLEGKHPSQCIFALGFRVYGLEAGV